MAGAYEGPLSEDMPTGMWIDEEGNSRIDPLEGLHYHHDEVLTPEGWPMRRVTACLIEHAEPVDA